MSVTGDPGSNPFSTKDNAWMMQSERVSDRQLIEALVDLYAARLSRLAARLAHLNPNSPELQDLVTAVLASAVNDRHRYWGDVSLYKWIAHRLPRQSKPPTSRSALPANAAPLSPAEWVDRIEAAARGSVSRRKRLRSIMQVSAAGLIIVLILAATSFSRSMFVTGTPTSPTATPAHYRGALNETKYRTGHFTFEYWVQPGDTLQLIAYRTGVSVDQINSAQYGSVNSATDLLNPGTILMLPASDAFRQAIFSPPPTSTAGLPLLTKDSTSEEIQARINGPGTWSTLKAHYFLVNSVNIPGTLFPVSEIIDIVLLAHNPDPYFMIISSYSPYAEQYDAYVFRVNDVNYFVNLSNGTIEANLDNDNIMEFLIRGMTLMGEELQPLTFDVIGETQVAGRPAVIVDAQASASASIRYWIDAQTGYTLRWNMGSTSDVSANFYGINIESIQYDLDIAPEWFDPGRPWGQFSVEQIQSSLGFTPLADKKPDWLKYDRIVPNPSSPPSGFDLGTAPLTLEWPGEWDEYMTQAGELEPPISYTVQVFGADYLLGTVSLRTGRLASCQRSSDGLKVAMIGMGATEREMETLDYSSILYLLELDPLGTPVELAPLVEYGPYSFSPNSQQFAWSGRFGGAPNGIHVYDFRSHDWRRLTDERGAYVYALGWSADSERVAFSVQDSASEEVPVCTLFSVFTDTGLPLLEKVSINCDESVSELRGLGFIVEDDPMLTGCSLP